MNNYNVSNIYTFLLEAGIDSQGVWGATVPPTERAGGNEERIRLAKIREAYDYDDEIDRSHIHASYLNWVRFKEYIVLWVSDKICKPRFIGVVAAKRGNDVYQARVRRSLQPVLEYLESEVKPVRARGIYKTNALFATLTYNPCLKKLSEAWQDIDIEFNRFTAALRKRYGRISVISCKESFKNGYPHKHAIIIFRDKKFSAFRMDNTWRVHRGIRNQIRKYWHSNIDVQAVVNAKSALSYITKYITKASASNEDPNTLAALWYFRKRSFGISHRTDLITAICTTKTSRNGTITHTTLHSDNFTLKYEFVGVFTAQQLGVDSKKWRIEFARPPDCLKKSWKQSAQNSGSYPPLLKKTLIDDITKYEVHCEEWIVADDST